MLPMCIFILTLLTDERKVREALLTEGSQQPVNSRLERGSYRWSESPNTRMISLRSMFQRWTRNSPTMFSGNSSQIIGSKRERGVPRGNSAILLLLRTKSWNLIILTVNYAAEWTAVGIQFAGRTNKRVVFKRQPEFEIGTKVNTHLSTDKKTWKSRFFRDLPSCQNIYLKCITYLQYYAPTIINRTDTVLKNLYFVTELRTSKRSRWIIRLFSFSRNSQEIKNALNPSTPASYSFSLNHSRFQF